MRKRSGLNFSRRRNRNNQIIKEAGSWAVHIFIAIFFAVIFVYFFGMRVSVIGGSMENTLYNGQQILVNRLSYLILGPKEGDIIVFRPTGSKNTHAYIKRVVAVPGDTVWVKDGRLFVNHEIMEYGYDKIMDA